MTIKEALSKITNKPKWYNWAKPNPLPQSTASITALRILQGNCKPETMQKFFESFGYSMDIEYKVTKK